MDNLSFVVFMAIAILMVATWANENDPNSDTNCLDEILGLPDYDQFIDSFEANRANEAVLKARADMLCRLAKKSS